MQKKEKRGAIELSVGTIVVVVLAMTMLVLGIVLIRSIFTSTTDSVEILDNNVKAQLVQLFSDESQKVIVKLGTNKIATVKSGTKNFGVAIAATTYDGSNANGRERVKYAISVGQGSCGKNVVEEWFESAGTPIGKDISFDDYDEDKVFALIVFSIPSGIAECSQKINIDVVDTTANQKYGSSFTIKVVKPGLFG